MKVIIRTDYKSFMAIMDAIDMTLQKDDYNVAYLYINKPKKLEIPSYGEEFYLSTNTYDTDKLKKLIKFLDRIGNKAIQIVCEKDDSDYASLLKFITEEYKYETIGPKSTKNLSKLYGDLMKIKNALRS